MSRPIAMVPLHDSLLHQLSDAGTSQDAAPSTDAWRRLLASLSRAYEVADAERAQLQRSVTSFSDEMVRLNFKVEAERDQLRLLFDCAPIGMLRSELDGRITLVNPALVRILGYSAQEILDCNPMSLIHPDDKAESTAAVAGLWEKNGAATRATQRRFIHKNGSIVYTNLSASVVADASGEPQFAIVAIEDISEKTRLELNLRQAQKLESVGRLAAGVAHEINTPIQFVGDNAEFLRAGFSDLLALCESYRTALDRMGALVPDAERAALAQAESAADYEYLRTGAAPAFAATLDGVARVAKIVQAMKSFAHNDRPERAPADLNQAIQNTIAVGAHELRHVADVVTDFEALTPLECHIGELNQVFLSLMVNAAHAIADVVGDSGARGTITVRTRREGSQVVVAVSDTGGGVPEAIRGRIFDPFFTTKDVGRGSGQGLSIARAVVERHGGTLTFESELGTGSTFWVRLPLSEPGAQAA